MSPECNLGDSPPGPLADLFTLSVMLFHIFFVHHPLFGKRVLSVRVLDLPAMMRLMAVAPVFIFDPADKSNEAVPRAVDPTGEAGANALEFWQLYPQFFRDLFIKAFTKGLSDPKNGRPSASDGADSLSRLRDSIGYCSNCGAENFFGADRGDCWACQSVLRLRRTSNSNIQSSF